MTTNTRTSSGYATNTAGCWKRTSARPSTTTERPPRSDAEKRQRQQNEWRWNWENEASLQTGRDTIMSEYCKYCGEKYSDAKSLLSNSCSHHPSGPRKGNHALFEGDKDGPFICIHCGQKYTSLQPLVTNRCLHNPDGRNHEAFEGNPHGPFRCKFCGHPYPDIRTMVTNRCTKNPEHGGNHRPAR